MKHVISLGLLASIAIFITSCKKYSVSDENSNATVLGKWNIVTDSAYTGLAFHENKVYYAGKLDDYFDFRNDGKLYSKEGATLDTATYQLTSDTTILIASFGFPAGRITNLTTHHANINFFSGLTPDGFWWRRVSLSR